MSAIAFQQNKISKTDMVFEGTVATTCNITNIEDIKGEQLLKSYASDLGAALSIRNSQVSSEAAATVIQQIAGNMGLECEAEDQTMQIAAWIEEARSLGDVNPPQGLPRGFFVIGSNEDAKLLYLKRTPVDELRNKDKVIFIGNALSLDSIVGSEYKKEFSFFDVDRHKKTLIIPSSSLDSSPQNVISLLRNKGWMGCDTNDARNCLMEYLRAAHTKNRKEEATRVGWGCDSYRYFVLPEHQFKAPGTGDILFTGSVAGNPYCTKGSFEEWKNSVGRWAAGNTRLTFALSLGLVGPFLKPAGLDSRIFSLVGDTSSGKTSILGAAASLWGEKDFVMSWDTTMCGLEANVSNFNNTLFCIDEMTNAVSDLLYNSTYALANGRGRATARTNRSAREIDRWETIILTTSELQLQELARKSGKTVQAGQLVRFIEIFAPEQADGSHSFFETLHEKNSSGDFVEALAKASLSHCGWAGPAFLNMLVNRREEALAAWSQEKDRLLGVLCEGRSIVGGEIRRVAQGFAITAFIGELATEWGIFPWEKGAAEAAAKACFDSWLSKRIQPPKTRLEERQSKEQELKNEIIQYVLSFIKDNKDSKFHPVGTPIPDDGSCIGYKKNFTNFTEYYFSSEGFKDAFCFNYPLKAVRRSLKMSGMLSLGDINSCQKAITLYSGHVEKCYALRIAENRSSDHPITP